MMRKCWKVWPLKLYSGQLPDQLAECPPNPPKRPILCNTKRVKESKPIRDTSWVSVSSPTSCLRWISCPSYYEQHEHLHRPMSRSRWRGSGDRFGPCNGHLLLNVRGKQLLRLRSWCLWWHRRWVRWCYARHRRYAVLSYINRSFAI